LAWSANEWQKHKNDYAEKASGKQVPASALSGVDHPESTSRRLPETAVVIKPAPGELRGNLSPWGAPLPPSPFDESHAKDTHHQTPSKFRAFTGEKHKIDPSRSQLWRQSGETI
jgi:hypothetical protein